MINDKNGEQTPLFWTHSLNRDQSWQWWLTYRESNLNLISFEVSWGNMMWHAYMRLGQEEKQLSFSVAGFGLFFYVGFNHLPIPKFLTHYQVMSRYLDTPRLLDMPRNLKLGLSYIKAKHWILEDSFLSVSLFSCKSMGGFDQPKGGPEFSLNPMNWIFGEIAYSNTTLQSAEVSLKFPEGAYPVKLDVERAEWKRPRYWKSLIVHRCSYQILDESKPIPTGNFKYGMPNDTYAATFPFQDDGGLPDDAIEVGKSKATRGIEREREKHGFQALA